MLLQQKGGTVVISTALYGDIPTYNSSGAYLGSYRSYGEYVVVDHHDGTMTLYAHGLPDSRVVNVNDEVSSRSNFNEIWNNRQFNRTTFTF